MAARKLRIATRTSPLALFQTQEVIDRLEQTYNDWTFPIIPILTKGDKDQHFLAKPGTNRHFHQRPR